MQNPFTVEPPDNVGAAKMLRLFVGAFGDHPKLTGSTHTFLNGHRGCGKSMMLRYLQPDCQCLERRASLRDLEFLGVYVPIKSTALDATQDSGLPDKRADAAIGEHAMCAHSAACAFASMNKPEVDLGQMDDVASRALVSFYHEVFTPLVVDAGGTLKPMPAAEPPSRPRAVLAHMESACKSMVSASSMYIKRRNLGRETPYDGPLLSYLDFLMPLIQSLRQTQFAPSGPVYLLVDDADWLSLSQTKILNSWVAARTTNDVCLKITTQFRYRTLLAASGQRVETPHDFTEINISSIYTSDHGNSYRKRLHSIIQKRLEAAGIDASPEEFFPDDTKQEAEIRDLGRELEEKWKRGEGRGYRPNDDAVRYARPTYMTRLAGSAKSTSTYRYAGWEQLTHISSGIARSFLEPAARMFASVLAKQEGQAIREIPPSIQNQVVREYSNEMWLRERPNLLKEPEESGSNVNPEKFKKLCNLIEALGGFFKAKLLDEGSSVRRVFSFVLSTHPDDELRAILELGVELGYLHTSTIGKKDGTGRTLLYVLNRRFAPAFYLDPTGFADYLHVTGKLLHEAMEKPDSLLRRIKKNPDSLDDPEPVSGPPLQLSFDLPQKPG